MQQITRGFFVKRLRFMAALFLVGTWACGREGTNGPPPTAPPTPRYHLAFGQTPTSTFVGRPMDPAVTVRVVDAKGNIVSSTTTVVTLALDPGTRGAAVLKGTLSATVVDGEARFPDLVITAPGNALALRAAAPDLTDIVSQAFVVDPIPVVIDSTVARLVGDSTERAAGLYRFALTSPGARVADSGTVITGVEQGGFIRRVESVRRVGSEVAFGTSAASLDEIIQNDSLIIRASLAGGVVSPSIRAGQASNLTLVPAAQGATCSPRQLECTLSDYVLLESPYGGVRLKQMHIRFNPQMLVDVHWNVFALGEVKIGLTGTIDADADWEIGLQGTVANSGSFTIFAVALSGVYWVEGIPIYVDFSVPVTVHWNFSAQGNVRVGAGWTSSASATAGAHYVKGNGWSSLTDAQFQFSPQWSSPTVVAGASLRLGVELRPRIVIDKVAGGEVWTQPFVQGNLSADLAGSPCLGPILS